VVLLDRILTIPCFLMTMDMYCIFTMNCSVCNKRATANFSIVFYGSAVVYVRLA